MANNDFDLYSSEWFGYRSLKLTGGKFEDNVAFNGSRASHCKKGSPVYTYISETDVSVITDGIEGGRACQ